MAHVLKNCGEAVARKLRHARVKKIGKALLLCQELLAWLNLSLKR